MTPRAIEAIWITPRAAKAASVLGPIPCATIRGSALRMSVVESIRP
jgi:hypothetical protein